MKQTPVYHEQDVTYRVVYRPHSRWFVQRFTGQKSSRVYDPWEDLGKPKDTQEQALLVMYQLVPLKLKA